MKIDSLHRIGKVAILFLAIMALLSGQASAYVGEFEVITDANISDTYRYNSSYMVISNSTGIHSFTFATEPPVNVRVSTNTEVVMQYYNGNIVRKTGAEDWNISYNGTYLNLTTNLSYWFNTTDYIIINFDPHDERMTTGLYGGGTRPTYDYISDTMVSYLARTGIDTFWYRSDDDAVNNSNGTFASRMKTNGTKVILRPYWWSAPSFVNHNYSTVRYNITAYNMIVSSIQNQIDRIGGANSFYAISLSEEEPPAGFHWDCYSACTEVQYQDYINVTNRLYNSTRALYPTVPIYQTYYNRFISESNKPLIIRDGLVDDAGYPSESTMVGVFNEWKLEQNNYSDLYAVLWGTSNNDEWGSAFSGWLPKYTINMTHLAYTKGIHNTIYFAMEHGLGGSSPYYNFVIADPPYNYSKATTDPKNHSGSWKAVIFQMVEMYSVNNLTKIDINFVSPTPSNNSVISVNYISLNYSTLTDSSSSITHNWNNSIPIWLRFEESIGLNVQNFGTSGNGTFSGETNVNRSNETLRGYGLYCDGTNDFLTVPSTNAANNITVIGWIKPTNDTGYIIAENTISTDMSFGIYLQGNGTNSYLQSHVNGVNRGLTNKSLNANASYYMFAWTLNNNSGNQFWINGVKNGYLDPYKSNLNHNTTTATVCKRMPSATLLKSTIYDLQVHDRVLTDEEIYSYWAGQFGLNITQTSLTDGSHNAIAYIQNVAGDIAQTETRYWTVDTSIPTEAQFTKVEFLWWE